jgi:transposase
LSESSREAQLREENERLERENAILRQKIDALVRRLFGSQSEKVDSAQLLLLLQGGEEAPPEPAESEAEPVKPRPSNSSPAKSERAPRLPEHLPVIEEVLDPEPVKADPAAWRCIGQEVSEQLDYDPARFLRRRLIRRKYVRRGDADAVPIIAPLPPGLQERSLPTAGLLAQILIAKFSDHLPLYRQEQIYRQRHGVHLPRQTMARWVGLAADWLRPIYDAIRTGVLAGGYVQADETPIDYLEPGHGRARKGYLWAYGRPGGDVLFDWQTSRAAACLDHVIAADFTGTIQCDGYSAYAAFARGHKGKITLAGCWAHVRRKFHEALEQSPRTTAWLLGQIGHLYRIERGLREQRAGPRLRAAIRAWQSRPIQERIRRALVRLKSSHRHLPQSLLGRAIDYALSQWPTLGAWLEDGRVEIGRVENRRGDGRREGVAVSGGFHHNAGASFSSMVPFPVPAPRTGRAAFPHPALIAELSAFAFDWSSGRRGNR